MLINLSNHPYIDWEQKQKEAAAAFGECLDLPFPPIDPKGDTADIVRLAKEYELKIIDLSKSHTDALYQPQSQDLSKLIDKNISEDETFAVHIMGEQTFCFTLISLLLKRGIRCIASCSVRDAELMSDGSKMVRFHFSRFRDYSSGSES